jgi:hypothetical protein
MPGPVLRRERRVVNPSASPNRATHADLPREEMLRDWLGVAMPEPSYYGLLGVPELETDEKVILQSARRVKRKVRAYQIGLYRKQALGLLAEVGQAVSTLTNPEKKRAYDSSLMARWREQAEDLARQHLGQGERTPQALEAWLTACRERGMPVARLMPYLMKRVMARSDGWPTVGVHHLVLPAAVWTYRDAAVLGQCLEAGPLEKRVESVKKTQRMLGIPLGVARMVAEEVGRSVHVFSELRLVRQAKDNPERTLLRLGRRIRRYGGDLGKGKVLAAVARLLGQKKADLDHALERIDEPPVEVTRGHKAARVAKERVRSLGGVAGAAAGWVADRPQILVSAAVSVGIVALVLAVLVVIGVLHLSGPGTSEAGTDGPDLVPPVTTGMEGSAGQSPATTGTGTAGAGETEGGESPGTSAGTSQAGHVRPEPAETDQEPPAWLKQFRERYPVKRPDLPKEEGPPPNVKFFGVKGEKRKDGSPVEPEPDTPAP